MAADPTLEIVKQLHANQIFVEPARVLAVSPFVLDNGLKSLETLQSYNPKQGDVVRVLRQGDFGLILGAVLSAPDIEEIQDPGGGETAPAKPASGITQIPATWSGTWRQATGGWRNDTSRVYQGSWGGRINHGYWGYAAARLAELRGATITAVQIFVTAVAGVGLAAAVPGRFRLHTATSKGNVEPSGYGSIHTASTPADGKSAWVDLPATWGAPLTAGLAYGVGVVSDTATEYAAFPGVAGTSSDPMSGCLKIIWTR